jgi:nicotinamide phosphoribosyltransferase
MRNLLLTTDSYKASHYLQYPPGTSNIYSYFESRGSDFPHLTREQIPFGLQYHLIEYLSGKPVNLDYINEAQSYYDKHLGPGIFNRAGWLYILEKHGGRLPVSIKAVPEGTPVPCGNVLMTIENTDPACYWLTNYLETLLVQVWYPTTVATLSREMKRVILDSLRRTGDPAGVDYKLHDFGFRGVSSVESAGIGGLAHLVNFKGTDTVAALYFGREYYACDMAGVSIPAAEHSTITSWGRSRETDAYENMLTQYPEGFVAVVSDSYDIYNACREWGSKLRAKVMGRNGTLVVRPDSGDPSEVVPNVLDILGEGFGYVKNEKGFKVLDPHVRVIQGDGINYEEVQKILGATTDRGWSTDNLAFGMGGALLQKLNRDTLKFAFKCSSAVVGGDRVEVYKRPVGASWKASKRGRLKLVANPDCGFVTLAEDAPGQNALVEVFRDGKLLVQHSLDEIRQRAALK